MFDISEDINDSLIHASFEEKQQCIFLYETIKLCQEFSLISRKFRNNAAKPFDALLARNQLLIIGNERLYIN